MTDPEHLLGVAVDAARAGGDVVAGAPGVQPELRRAVARHADEAALTRLTEPATPPTSLGQPVGTER